MCKASQVFAVLLCLSFSGYGQESMITGGTKSASKSERFFIAVTSSTYLDIVTSKVEMVPTFTGYDFDPISGQSVPRYDNVPYQSRCWSIVSIGLEPRYNLYEMDDNSALAVSVPISFGLGMTNPANFEVRGMEGIGSMQIPLLLKLYVGNHSTFNTKKDFGISIGGGFEYNKVGLIDVSGDPEPVNNKGWIMPVGTMGIHFWRGIYPFEINVKYGVSSFQEYSVDGDGNPIQNEAGAYISRKARASSFKITFVSLMNY